MKKFNIISILSVFLVWLVSCGNPLDPGEQPLDWIALEAVIEDNAQIVLLNYYDPSQYVLITNNDNQNVAPKFSDDKLRLIYQSRSSGFVHDPQLVLYDLKSGKTRPLVLDKMMTEKLKFPVTGEGVVWSPGGNRIYYRVSDITFSGSEDLLYYDFGTNTEKRLTFTAQYSEIVQGFMGLDTLIVFSTDTAATGERLGYYVII